MPKYNFWGDPIPDDGADPYQLAPVAASPQRVDVATGKVSGGIGPGTYLPGESNPVWAAQLPVGATAGQAAQADANQLAGMVDLIAGKNVSNASNPWGAAETASRGSFKRTPSQYSEQQASQWLSPAEQTVLPHAQSAADRFAYSNTAPDFATQHQLALGGGSSSASAGGLTPGSWGDFGAAAGSLVGRAPGPAPTATGMGGPTPLPAYATGVYTSPQQPAGFGGTAPIQTARPLTPAEIATGVGAMQNPNLALPGMAALLSPTPPAQLPINQIGTGTGANSPNMAALLNPQLPAGSSVTPAIQQLLQSLQNQQHGTGAGGNAPQMGQLLLQQLLAAMGTGG